MPKSNIPSISNPYENENGYETSRPNKITGGWNVLYKTEDNEIGKWCVYCSTHGTVTNLRVKRTAVSMLLHPIDWCSKCKTIQETTDAKNFLTIHHTSERPYTDQMVMLAKLAKGDPEKCLMFEELHGIKPNTLWD